MSRLGCVILWISLSLGQALGQAPVSFVRDIAPVLVKQCQGCHGPKKVKGGYRVDTFEHLLKPGKSDSPAIARGKPAESELFLRLTTGDANDLMPQDGDPLPPKQIELVKRWIVEGAKFDGTTETAALAGLLQPVEHPPSPESYPSPVPITALEFGPEGERLFASGYREVTIWNTISGELLGRLGNVAERVYDLAVSAEGRLLAVACGQPGRLGEVRLFDLASGELRSVPVTTADVVFAVAFSNDGNRLAAGSADNKLRLVEVESGKVTHELGSHSDWVNSVAWNADDSRLVTASRDNTAKVFDASTGERIVSYLGHQNYVRAALFHKNGKEIFSIGDDQKMHHWKIEGPKKVNDSSASRSTALAIARIGTELLIAGDDRSVRAFNINIKDESRKWDGHKDAVLSVTVSAATRQAASGAYDGEVVLWDIDEGKIIRRFQATPGGVEGKENPPLPRQGEGRGKG